MRFYGSAKELISEIARDLDEMGLIVKPKSYQNKIVEGNDQFITKEIQMYNYALTDLPDLSLLFLFENTYEWCLAEFKERIDPSGTINPGDAWKLRKDLWANFLVDGKFDYTYNERLQWNNNLQRLIDRARKDPDSRQLYLPIFNPSDVEFIGGKKRVPCSLGYYFLIREGKVHMTYIQRSADFAAHFGNDVFLAWLMKEYFAEQLGLKPGYLFHSIFSLHIYKKDWFKLEKGLGLL